MQQFLILLKLVHSLLEESLSHLNQVLLYRYIIVIEASQWPRIKEEACDRNRQCSPSGLNQKTDCCTGMNKGETAPWIQLLSKKFF